MKKIIFVPFIDAFGGVERLIVSLAKNLHDEKKNYSVVCFRDSIGLAKYVDFELDIVCLNPPRNSLLEGWCLGRYFRGALNGEYQALVFDLNGSFYAGMFSPAGYTLHLTDPPSLLPTDISKYASSFTGSWSLSALKAELVHRLNKRGVRKARRVIAMTNVIRTELQQRYGVDAVVVRPGIDVSEESSDKGRNPDEFRFLSVCRLEDNKRIDWMLTALSQLECMTPSLGSRVNWFLDIVGSGPNESSLRSMAQSLGLGNRVVFHGRVSDGELNRIYSQAGMFLMPAVQGYGLPALEALSRGVPVVMHQDSGVSEILGGSPWVSILSDDGGSALAAKIDFLLNRISNGELIPDNQPAIPTDHGWAKEINEVWISNDK
ncbi:glycosyltransferase family 4 protein [Mariprofundus erugo]|uniref:glycosyltransferase family 4 protein n=1 Tax=Mariprofundus erugo TaxID=2528639 RepID=UPI0010FE845F|nr:glycosyltransferase family 4 protein [Mariprofundus erugo]TLS78402.1 glycosyltransferase family 4 protein [Mariprofundus erugo]